MQICENIGFEKVSTTWTRHRRVTLLWKLAGKFDCDFRRRRASGFGSRSKADRFDTNPNSSLANFPLLINKMLTTVCPHFRRVQVCMTNVKYKLWSTDKIVFCLQKYKSSASFAKYNFFSWFIRTLHTAATGCVPPSAYTTWRRLSQRSLI